MRSLGCDSPSAGSNCVLCVVQVLAADKAKSTIRVGAGMRYTEFLKEAQKAGMSVQVRLTRAGIDGPVTVLLFAPIPRPGVLETCFAGGQGCRCSRDGVLSTAHLFKGLCCAFNH